MKLVFCKDVSRPFQLGKALVRAFTWHCEIPRSPVDSSCFLECLARVSGSHYHIETTGDHGRWCSPGLDTVSTVLFSAKAKARCSRIHQAASQAAQPPRRGNHTQLSGRTEPTRPAMQNCCKLASQPFIVCIANNFDFCAF